MSAANPVWIHNLIYWSKYPVHTNHLGYPSNWYISTIVRKIAQLEAHVMSAKNSSKSNKMDWQNTVFVQYKLSKEDKVKFDKWSEREPSEVALDIATFMSSGAKTSISWDTNNNVWIVSSTMKEESDKSYNECLTSRSDDWYEALRMNCFKGSVLAKGQKWSSLQVDANWG